MLRDKRKPFRVKLITFHEWYGALSRQRAIPANTRRTKHVTITSKRYFGVIIACSWHCGFAGIIAVIV